MEDTPVSIIGIIIASIIMFVVPLTLLADRNDDIAQLVIQTHTAEFVDTVIKTGKITVEQYENFMKSLETSGNNYDIDFEIKVHDPNPAQYATNNSGGNPGANAYYSIFTSQVEDQLQSNGELILKDGDEIYVTVRNNSQTLSQTLKSFYYTIAGDDLYILSSTSSGTIAINGAT